MNKTEYRKAIIEMGVPVISVDKCVNTNVTWFTTGVVSFDWLLGSGIPMGRIVEIFGEESSGKSLLCTVLAAKVVKAGGIAVLFDMEHSFDPVFAEMNGLDVDDEGFVYISDSDYSLEDVYFNINQFAQLSTDFTKPVIIIWDSLESTQSKREQEQAKKGVFGAHEHGSHRAQINSKSLRQVHGKLADSDISLVLINQTRQRVDNPYGSKINTSGGQAARFYAAVRVFIKRVGKIDNVKGDKIGIKCSMEAIKNKVNTPYRKSSFTVTIDDGFDDTDFLLQLAVQKGILSKKSGGWYSYGDGDKFQGYKNLTAELREKILADIHKVERKEDE